MCCCILMLLSLWQTVWGWLRGKGLARKVTKKEAGQKRQRRSHWILKKKSFPEGALSQDTKAQTQRLPVVNPGDKKDSLNGTQKSAPKFPGKSSLLAKRSSTSTGILRGTDSASTRGRPCQHLCCAGDCKGLKNRAMEAGQLSQWLKRKPRERRKVTFKLESLCKESEVMMPPGPVVVKPQRKQNKKKKTPLHED